MAPTFETLEPHINEIRDYIFGDLGRITGLDLGVNYMAAGIMMCACDRPLLLGRTSATH